LRSKGESRKNSVACQLNGGAPASLVGVPAQPHRDKTRSSGAHSQVSPPFGIHLGEKLRPHFKALPFAPQHIEHYCGSAGIFCQRTSSKRGTSFRGFFTRDSPINHRRSSGSVSGLLSVSFEGITIPSPFSENIVWLPSRIPPAAV